MKMWTQWTRFAIGLKDDEMINIQKVNDKGNLIGFRDNEPTTAKRCRSAR
jgi:hypothetical protein